MRAVHFKICKNTRDLRKTRLEEHGRQRPGGGAVRERCRLEDGGVQAANGEHIARRHLLQADGTLPLLTAVLLVYQLWARQSRCPEVPKHDCVLEIIN